ncbi:MAG: hypothetical protein ABEI32_02890 [Halothece sp.]
MIFLGVYQDWFLAVWTINRLLVLTNEQILVRSDGHYNHEFASVLLQRERVLIVRGDERLKVSGNGGLYTHTWLSLFLRFSLDSYLIKIDPDTGINHPPTFPAEFDVACNFMNGALRGGAVAFTRQAVQMLVASRFLLDEKYQPLRWCYRWRNTEWIPCEDAILYDAIQRLGLTLVHWDDVYCRHSAESFNPPYSINSYSFYHPIGRTSDE